MIVYYDVGYFNKGFVTVISMQIWLTANYYFPLYVVEMESNTCATLKKFLQSPCWITGIIQYNHTYYNNYRKVCIILFVMISHNIKYKLHKVLKIYSALSELISLGQDLSRLMYFVG